MKQTCKKVFVSLSGRDVKKDYQKRKRTEDPKNVIV